MTSERMYKGNQYGRPRMNGEEARTRQLTVTLTDAEARDIGEAANKGGLTLSSCGRVALLEWLGKSKETGR